MLSFLPTRPGILFSQNRMHAMEFFFLLLFFWLLKFFMEYFFSENLLKNKRQSVCFFDMVQALLSSCFSHSNDSLLFPPSWPLSEAEQYRLFSPVDILAANWSVSAAAALWLDPQKPTVCIWRGSVSIPNVGTTKKIGRKVSKHPASPNNPRSLKNLRQTHIAKFRRFRRQMWR